MPLAVLALFLRPIPWEAPLAVLIAAQIARRRIAPGKRTLRNLNPETRGTIALSMVSGLVCIFIVAAGMWLIGLKQPKPMGIYASDSKYIWTLAPNTQGKRGIPLENGSKEVWSVRISSQGFRDRVVGPKQPNEFRVLMVGDSFAMGWGLTRDQTMTAVLQKALARKAPGRKITVIDGGVVGYGPWQERGFLHERGFALHPDLVIEQLFPSNDVEGSLEEVDKHLEAYDADWKQNFYGRKDRDDWHVKIQVWILYHVPGWRTIEHWTGNENLVIDALNLIRFLPPYKEHHLAPSAPREYYLEPDLKKNYATLNEGWRRLKNEVLGMQQDCKEHGIAFMAFCVPEAASVVDSLWQKEVVDAGKAALYERAKEVRVTEDFFRKHDIDYVSILKPLRADSHTHQMYFYYDRHFAPGGARIAGETLANYVCKKYLGG